ncbi:MAG: pectin acetylesterase-family hydrolase [Kofleriaceae bacterium]
MKYLLLLAVAACAVDADDPPGVDAQPIAAAPLLQGPVGEWTWFDLPGAVCGYGQQTGIGVSVGAGSDVLIYLEGGGLCWDEVSCEVNVGPVVLASYFTNGFTKATFDGILAGGGYSAGIFDRTLANNPYKDATQIYVPYCTGDVHTGSTKRYFPFAQQVAHFAGRENLELALAAITASFPATTRVTLSGSSAGGYGALFNFPRVQEVFGATRVDLVSDSGPVFSFSPFLQQGYPVWNTNAVIPDDCEACLADYHNLYDYYARTYSGSRMAFVSHDEDLVIAAGHLQLPYPSFYFTMKAFTQGTLAPLANWRYFVAAGTGHTSVYELREPSIQKQRICLARILGTCLAYDPFHEIEVSRTVLADWLTQMATDDPAWANTTSINQ